MVIVSLSLSLFVPGILLVNDVQFTFAPDDLAFRAAFLYGGFNFHLSLLYITRGIFPAPAADRLFIPEYYPSL